MTDISRNEAAQIAALCTECGVPHLAAGFLGQGLGLDEVKTRVSKVGTVMQMAAIARRKEPSIPAELATNMLAEGFGIQEIRAELFNRIVVEEEKTSISSHVPVDSGSAGLAASRLSMERTLKAMGVTPKDGAGA
ncbi:hypothetical protein [Methylobacterium sp. P5_C11]